MISEIKAALNKVARQGRAGQFDSDGDWTMGVDHELATIGKGKHYIVRCCKNTPARNGPGFLFDHVWLSCDRDNNLKTCKMILECEWNQHDKKIREDFCKLLLGKAPLKIMVFQKATESEVGETFEKIETWIHKFTYADSAKETYLLCGFVYDRNEQYFRYKRIVSNN